MNDQATQSDKTTPQKRRLRVTSEADIDVSGISEFMQDLGVRLHSKLTRQLNPHLVKYQVEWIDEPKTVDDEGLSEPTQLEFADTLFLKNY